MKRWCARLTGCTLIFFCTLGFSAVYAGEKTPAGGDGASLRSIVDLLKRKKLITDPEAADLLKRSGTGEVPAGELHGLVDLLRAKGLISDREAAGFLGSAVPASGEIVAEPAGVAVTGQAGKKPVSSQGDAVFLVKLKERWITSGNEGEDFDALAAHSTVPDVIGRMRLMGALSATEADKLDELYLARSPRRDMEENVEAATASLPKRENLILPDEDRVFIDKLRERWVKRGNKAADFDDLFVETKDVEQILGRMRTMGIISGDEADRLEKIYRSRYLSGAISAVLETKEKEYIGRIENDVAWQIDSKIEEKLKHEWWQTIRFNGDFRLRYEGDFFGSDNGAFEQPANPSQLMNTTVERDRLRIRARLGATAKVADETEVGLGLSTGTTSNPSPNATLGDSLNNKSIVLDKAFVKWSPDPSLTLWGGRFTNPWFFTDLVWYPDLNFDGAAFQYRPQLTQEVGLFLTGGAFPIQEVEVSARDKWLFGGQVGVHYRRPDNIPAKLGVAYYYYVHTEGRFNDPNNPNVNDWTAPQFQQKGNTLMNINANVPGAATKTAYASRFRELNVTGQLDLGLWDPVHLVFTGDFVKNLAFNRGDVEAIAFQEISLDGPVSPGDTGYQVGVTVGYPTVEKFGDWKGLLFYKHLESDAVIDAFTDQDFHLGGTNAKGWIVGGDFGLTKNVWLSTRWYTADQISGPPLAIDVFQFNLNAKF